MPKETDRLKLPLPLGNESVTRESINGIFEKIDAGVATREDLDTLREAVSQMDIPDASLTQKGKVQLSDKTNGTSDLLAATEKALGLVMTEAAAAKQLGVETKNDVVATLNSIGVSASTNDSWAQLITKMAGVIRATGNATSAQVLSGATFSNASSNGFTGTMPNRGAGGSITPGVTAQSKAAGYYSTAITVPAEPNLIPANILKTKSIYGVAGSLDPNRVVEIPSTLKTIDRSAPWQNPYYETLIELNPNKRTLILFPGTSASQLIAYSATYPDIVTARLGIETNNGMLPLSSAYVIAASQSYDNPTSRVLPFGQMHINPITKTITYMIGTTSYTQTIPGSSITFIRLCFGLAKYREDEYAPNLGTYAAVRYQCTLVEI